MNMTAISIIHCRKSKREIMDISYDYYRIFYHVARCGSITQAARMLMHDQPNLTRAIRALEGELGCPLYIRSNRGVRLTPEGERLFAHVRIAVENIEAGEAELMQTRNLQAGSVYVAASELALHCALLPALKKYRALYPAIRLKISNHSTPQAIDAVSNGIADLALVTTPTVVSAAVEEQTVSTFSEVAVCSTAFSELAGRSVSFEELLSYPLISLGAQTKSFELYSSFFASRGLQYRPETETATADQILPMIQADLGIGFIPEAFLTGAEHICVIDTEAPLPEREIRIVRRRDQPLSIAAQRLYRLILDLARE